jgi:hypothetical protein
LAVSSALSLGIAAFFQCVAPEGGETGDMQKALENKGPEHVFRP